MCVGPHKAGCYLRNEQCMTVVNNCDDIMQAAGYRKYLDFYVVCYKWVNDDGNTYFLRTGVQQKYGVNRMYRGSVKFSSIQFTSDTNCVVVHLNTILSIYSPMQKLLNAFGS